MRRAWAYDHTQVRDMRRTTLTNEVSSSNRHPHLSLSRPERHREMDAFQADTRANA